MLTVDEQKIQSSLCPSKKKCWACTQVMLLGQMHLFVWIYNQQIPYSPALLGTFQKFLCSDMGRGDTIRKGVFWKSIINWSRTRGSKAVSGVQISVPCWLCVFLQVCSGSGCSVSPSQDCLQSVEHMTLFKKTKKKPTWAKRGSDKFIHYVSSFLDSPFTSEPQICLHSSHFLIKEFPSVQISAG